MNWKLWPFLALCACGDGETEIEIRAVVNGSHGSLTVGRTSTHHIQVTVFDRDANATTLRVRGQNVSAAPSELDLSESMAGKQEGFLARNLDITATVEGEVVLEFVAVDADGNESEPYPLPFSVLAPRT